MTCLRKLLIRDFVNITFKLMSSGITHISMAVLIHYSIKIGKLELKHDEI